MVGIAKKKYSVTSLIFDISWVIFIAYNILNQSAWVALDETGIFYSAFRYIKVFAALLGAVVILMNLIKKVYSLKSIIAYCLLGAVIAVSAYFSHNLTYVWIFFLFAAAYKQDAKRVITISAIVTAIMMLIIILSCPIGVNIDYIFEPETRHRHGLGFGWTTTGPIMYFFLMLQYIFLRKETMRFYEYIGLEGIAVFFFLMTNTRVVFMLSTFVLVFMFVEGLLKNRWKFWSKLKWLWLALPVIVCVGSVVIYAKYDWFNQTWYDLNQLMNNRLTMGQWGILEYGYSILGQVTEWRGYYITAPEVVNYNYVDCSYIQIMLEFGIVFMAATLIIYIKSIYNGIKARDYHLVFIMIFIVLFSFMEPRLMNMAFNVFPIMAFLAV